MAQDRRVDLEGRSVATSRRRPRRAACSGPCWRAARNWSRPRRHGFRRPVFRVARAGRPQRRLTAGCSQQSGSRCRNGRTSSRPPRRWTAARSPPARAAGRTSSCPTRPLRTGAPRVDGLALPRRPTPLQLPRDPAAKPWRRSRAAEQIPPLPATSRKTATGPYGSVRGGVTERTPADTIRSWAAAKSSTRRRKPTRPATWSRRRVPGPGQPGPAGPPWPLQVGARPPIAWTLPSVTAGESSTRSKPNASTNKRIALSSSSSTTSVPGSMFASPASRTRRRRSTATPVRACSGGGTSTAGATTD